MATRLALKAAALDLVSERGLSNVTVEDIADAVDVSVRTFFNYFRSKEAAVIGDEPEAVEAMCAQLLALAPEVAPLEAIRTVLVARVTAVSDDIDVYGDGHNVWRQRFAAIYAQPEVMMAYTKYLAAAERALTEALVRRLGGDERLRGYASLVTTCALGVMRVAATFWGAAVDESGASWLEFTTAGFDSLSRGLAFEPISSDGYWSQVEQSGVGWTGPDLAEVLEAEVLEAEVLEAEVLEAEVLEAEVLEA